MSRLDAFFQTVRAEVSALEDDPRTLRQFGLVVGGVLLTVAGLLLWRRGASAWTWGLAGVGGPLVLLGLIAPVVLGPVRDVWMTLAFVMGAVMTRVILTLAFVLIFVPTGWLLKLFGKDLLRRRLDPDAETYWIPRDDGRPDRESLESYF
ncbi:SxtJ family membrane protein [Rubrivirga sp.]|uniref:SxtJ family membrane protein n=1 Tax=Rubrivirga sp. TaxID=1885344 RepID=UPI003C73FC8A